jgi:hypothetical protein
MLRRTFVPLACGFLACFRLGFLPGLAAPAEEQRYPASSSVIDVTQPPYGAKADGLTDDTEALQRALNENVGRHRAIYLPAGTYRVSRTLTWPKRWNGHDNWGHTLIRGQHRDRTVLLLQAGTFTNASKPQAMMACGGFGSADWFHNYVENLTFDVGTNNAGATALQFYSNNSGAVRDCRFLAPAGSGVVGLDLAHQDMNGPLLVRNCEVVGFRRGVTAGHAVNGQVIEHLSVRGQSEFGLDNAGQTLSVRGFRSDNAVPAIRTYGTFCLLDAQLTGRAGASRLPALLNYNGGRLMVRDLSSSGYGRAIADVASPDFAAAYRVVGTAQPGSAGPEVGEYFSVSPTRQYPGSTGSMRLPVRETPDAGWEAPEAWANVDRFGADPTGEKDSAGALQRAVDSGATTVFLPGSYRLLTPVELRGRVRRLVGLGGMINYGKGLKADFRLVDGEAPVVWIEHLGHVDGGLEIASRRTLVLRSVSDCDLKPTPAAQGADWYLEDVVTHDLRLAGQRVWARQLNIENEGVHLTNAGGALWILGYKTERGGTLLDTRASGKSEVLGGFSYTTTSGRLGPMFRSVDASFFAYFGEVCYNGDPYSVLVEEIRRDETRTLKRPNGNTVPYVGWGP